METSHLVSLADGWHLWRCAMIRSAGFEANRVLLLAAPASALISSEIAELQGQFDEAVGRARTAIAMQRGDAAFMKVCSKALAKLSKGKAPSTTEGLGDAQPLADEVVAIAANLAQCWGRFSEVFLEDAAKVSQALGGVASDDAFREAVCWQNREAARICLPAVRAIVTSPNSRQRGRQSLVAGYLQRYCVKNDSIGFFGPVGWGTFSDESFSVTQAENFLARRRVYFEHWPMEALASEIGSDPSIIESLCPRLLPNVRVEGEVVTYGASKSVEVPTLVADVLRCCDGSRTARSIAASCLLRFSSFEDSDDVFELLEELVAKGLITWRIDLPSGIMGPAGALRTILEKLPESEGRHRGLEALGKLEVARLAVEHAAGDPDAVASALQSMTECLAGYVDVDSKRGAGKMYVAKAPVYEDCERAMDVELGQSFRTKLGPALVQVLGSARWFTSEIARGYRELADELFAELTSDDVPSVDFASFWKRLSVSFPTSAATSSSILAAAQRKLRERWCEALGLVEGTTTPVHRNSIDIAAHVAQAFAADAPGWPSARHISPDIMLGASGPDALERDDFFGVLGEIHIGNTLPTPWALQQHPDPDGMIRWKDIDLAERGICPVQPKEFVTRVDRVSYSDRDFSLEVGPSRSWRDSKMCLRVADLVVEKAKDGLRVRERDSDTSFDIIAFLDQYITFASSSNFSWAPSWQYVPRVTLDNLVIMRETWRFAVEELPFRTLPWGHKQFHACHAWASEQGLPRFVFFKVPEEPKPVFLDFDSPQLVSRACTMLKKATRITLSEFLPDFDSLWLPDSEGQRYTSEVRCVAVDPQHWERHSAEQG
jgi:hypothetical protein